MRSLDWLLLVYILFVHFFQVSFFLKPSKTEPDETLECTGRHFSYLFMSVIAIFVVAVFLLLSLVSWLEHHVIIK